MESLFILAANPVEHVIDKPLVQVGGVWAISNVTVMLVLSAIVTYLLVVPAAKKIRTGSAKSLDDFRAQGTLPNLVEAVCLYLRNEVFKDVLGDQTDRFTPILWTFFWFILVCNLIGLIPILDLTALFGLGHHGHGTGGPAVTRAPHTVHGLAVRQQ